MSIIDFNSAIWSDPWFNALPFKAKVLFIYLWTNDHKNLSGLYSLGLKTISFETGLSPKDIDDSLQVLNPKVKYDYQGQIVFVVNHVKHQFYRTGRISPKIIEGLKKNLLLIPKGHEFIGEFLSRYEHLNIGYPYPIDRVSIYPSSAGGGGGGGGGEVKEEGCGEKPKEKKKFLDHVFLTEEEHQKLIEQLGENETTRLIKQLNNYIGSKGKKYKSHYFTILTWSENAGNKPKGSTGATPEKKGGNSEYAGVKREYYESPV